MRGGRPGSCSFFHWVASVEEIDALFALRSNHPAYDDQICVVGSCSATPRDRHLQRLPQGAPRFPDFRLTDKEFERNWGVNLCAGWAPHTGQ